LVCGVESVGFLERFGVERNDGVDIGTLLVERFDAIEVGLHQLAAGQLTGFISGMNIIDCRFQNVEGCY
jgi:hypothetical protein